MSENAKDQIAAAQVVLPCNELDATLEFFMRRLGFRVEMIYPADAPRIAVLNGHGLRVRLERGASGTPGVLRLLCRDPAAVGGGATTLQAPNGTRIDLVEAEPKLDLPPLQPEFVISRSAGGKWGTGRAGMRYRDLIPSRLGGRFIASHIQIPTGGPVPDYVHFHKIAFQMIFCRKGWVRVVYEDQGQPFVMQAGDCVLQPPRIRHRVLEASDGLEVVEVTCPAEHETAGDLQMSLPNGITNPDRIYGGQHFVRHEAAKTPWEPWRMPGFEARDTGIGAATGGLAGARVVRPRGAESPMFKDDAEFSFLFVLDGAVTLRGEGGAAHRLGAGDSAVVPKGMAHALAECTGDLQLLEVTEPARVASAAV